MIKFSIICVFGYLHLREHLASAEGQLHKRGNYLFPSEKQQQTKKHKIISLFDTITQTQYQSRSPRTTIMPSFFSTLCVAIVSACATLGQASVIPEKRAPSGIVYWSGALANGTVIQINGTFPVSFQIHALCHLRC